MHKAFFSYILCILLPKLIVAQIDRTRTWVFGESIGIHFNKSGTIDTIGGIFKPNYPQGEGTGVYNDSNGNLLYYVLNGKLIGNDHKPINTDFSMGGSSSASQANIITSLNDSVFHIFGTSSGFDCNYSCYDKNNNKFKVFGKSLIYRASESQALVNHQNGKWKWVVFHSRLGDTLYSYLINENGLETCPVISHAGPFYKDWYPGQGCMKFSPDGRFLAFASLDEEKVTFCSFNNLTGEIRKVYIINIIGFPYGVEFSRDKKLFVSTLRPGKIWEYDLEETDSISVLKSKRLVFDTLAEDFIYQLQNAPDEIIYVADYQSDRMGKLFKKNAIWHFGFTKTLFANKLSNGGFPSFNASYFYTPSLNFNYSKSCRNNNFHFSAIDTFGSFNWSWLFSKGNNTYSSTGKSTQFIFPDSGIWQVRCIASNGIRKDTMIKSILILKPLESDFLGRDILLIAGSNINGILNGPKNMHCIHWQKEGDTSEVKSNNYTYTDTGYYICEVKDPVFCEYKDTIRVKVCDSFARKAVIERVGDSLISKTYAKRYQWYKVIGQKDSLIQGAVYNQLKLNAAGMYKLRTWNTLGCDSTSEVIQVKKLGIKQYDQKEFKIIPNPSNGIFNISSEQIPISTVTIYDVSAKSILEFKYEKTKKAEIKADLNAGLYFIQINGMEWTKMIIE